MLGKFLTIRTRLMIMLLLVSLLACGVLSYVGSQYGYEVIGEEVTNQLTLVRAAKKSQIESYFHDISNFVEVMGQNEMVIDATKDFKLAFQKLAEKKLDANCSQALSEHYGVFLEKLVANIDAKPDVDLYYPKNIEGCYLQFEYIVDNPSSLGEKDDLIDAEDGSEYSRVHRKYHEYFRSLIKKFDFYDVFLIDLDKGDIVYSAYKETDFATNLFDGPYRTSNLADLARKLKMNSDLESATWMDFAAYRPSYGAPAGFIGVPLSSDGETVGALVFQLPVGEINGIMTGDENWAEDGLGESGESYLVGEDFMMRSISRFYLQDTVGYTEALIASGERQENIDQMYRFGTTILQQRIRSDAVLEALDGKTDTKIIKDYRGVKVISAYAPLGIDGLNWVILSEKDEAEAFIPALAFNRRMLITTIILVLIVTLLAMILSSRFVKPIEELTQGVKRIIDGDASHRVDIQSQDEFGILGSSFNTMVSQVETQNKEIEEKSKQIQGTLLNFIPAEYAQRLAKGEKGFAYEYQNLSLIAIDLVGFGGLTSKLGADASVNLLNDIVDAFDESAERNYIEKIRTVGDTYFAACGLFNSRLDHAKRIVQFAVSAMQLVDQFNLNHTQQLKVQISITSGDVVAGIVGHDKFTFDVWGKTVNQLFKINELDLDETILASNAIAERLDGFYKFEELPFAEKIGEPVFKLIDKISE